MIYDIGIDNMYCVLHLDHIFGIRIRRPLISNDIDLPLLAIVRCADVLKLNASLKSK